ncbi:hypothetical protein NUW58_g3413 [Xylaria curta]|uniref:Uncharacterized protein n=1 Tax=Xylaria curta TaxID=42375 RepID=A0ACC1PCP5_9PEZI|nr:hypothetical protein NUW58_g3413 [Xylaria curta]
MENFELLDYQPNSQIASTIEANFLPPLEDSQETQVVASDWHGNGGDHEKDATSQSQQLTESLFIRRPEPEDPRNFQFGFQYTKAQAPQILPVHPKAPPKGVIGRTDSRNDNDIQPKIQFHGPSHQAGDDPLNAPRNMLEVGIHGGKAQLTTSTQNHDAILVPSDSSSDTTMPTKNQTEDRHSSITQKDSPLEPPFQNHPPFRGNASDPFQRTKEHTRSPINKVEKPKLPKAIANIQRKALIQSNHTQRHDSSPRCSKSQAVRVSPSRFNKEWTDQNMGNTHESSPARTRRHQKLPIGDAPLHQQSDSLEIQTLLAAAGLRKHRSNVATTTCPLARVEDENENFHGRPTSRASNISKPRASAVRKHTRRRRDTPNLETSNELRQSLGESWNKYFIHEAKQTERWKEKMQDMINQLSQRDDRIAEFLAKIQQKDQMIMDLSNQNEERDTLFQKQESAIAESEKRRQGMRGKLNEYKDRLNDATKEQQNIFKYFQPRYHQMREQLQLAEDSHRISLEQALSTANNVRNQIRGSLEEVKALSRDEIAKLNTEIATLRVKIVERDEASAREKEHIDGLRQELTETHQMNGDVLESLREQNLEIIDKSKKRDTQLQNIEESIHQQGLSIHSLLENLEMNKASAITSSQLAESLKAFQTKLLDCVRSEFREREASSREISSNVTSDLKPEILGIHKLCTDLNTHIQDCRKASEWQERHGKVQMDHQTLLWEAGQLKEKLAKMRDKAKAQLEQHEGLQQELLTLRASANAAEEFNNRIKNLETTEQQILGSLNEKEIQAQGLEAKLKLADEVLSIQKQQLEDQERKNRDEHEEHAREIAMCRELQEQAIEQAINEESARVRAEFQDIQDRLKGAEQDYTRLQKEFVQAKQEARNELKASEDEAARQVQEFLEPAVNRIDKALDGLVALDEAKDDLKTNLEVWSSNRIELSLLQQAVQKLAKDQQMASKNGQQLGELLDVTKKFSDSFHYYKSETDAFNRAIELAKTVNAEKGRAGHHGHKRVRARGKSHPQHRRVTIQAPRADNGDGGKAVSVSIEEERATRRQAPSPIGIMKPAFPRAESPQEESYQNMPLTTSKPTRESSGRRVANRGGTLALPSHSTYNRPVSGTSVKTEEPTSEQAPETMGTMSTATSSTPRKRKSAEIKSSQEGNAEQKQSQSITTRRVKLSRSMSSDFFDSISEEPAAESVQPRTRPQRPRGGPIERRSRPFATYGSSN